MLRRAASLKPDPATNVLMSDTVDRGTHPRGGTGAVPRDYDWLRLSLRKTQLDYMCPRDEVEFRAKPEPERDSIHGSGCYRFQRVAES